MKILFLDLDGTVREPSEEGEKFIGNDYKKQRIIAGVKEAISQYEDWFIIGISNQGGVKSGYKTLDNCIAEQRYTMELIPQIKVVYFCPDMDGLRSYKVEPDNITEYVDEDADLVRSSEDDFKWIASFRKPSPGMVKLALKEYGGLVEDCFMVGDRPEDEQCAKSAGIRFIPAVEWRVQTID
ncbi:HAD hydrolase-like protein [Aetokthonos hydrillicola Thurmond2011]|jgi:D-glycero-D-manno-heptose 1,7-bisphosphate phosphatase|uniref:HAD hydrolase-like protein n=1 Tax=Aetokthonos hydrillicola Thurmond2011 TaxID=2712845 RepID=A0AAP5I237_9CYAN|nr:HAD hydrolase-like protein [Aetokthonos hydrillicola]MBO3463578.1 HAD hydrolase-like protein [Aetokthonos hydrillicola CCALA 1050]MDR9893281.1 HAD hydrolase-like protein [Aetokthonos hydrillicola Thurmond2011]